MSILSSGLGRELDGIIRLDQFLDAYNPTRFEAGVKFIGTVRGPIKTLARSSDVKHTPNLWRIDGTTLFCSKQAVVSGDIPWSEWGIHKLSCDGDIQIQHSCGEMPEALHSTLAVIITDNYCRFENHIIECNRVDFNGLCVGDPDVRGIYDVEFHCHKLNFYSTPDRLVRVGGSVDYINFHELNLSDIEEKFGNVVKKQVCGPKKLNSIKDVRAFYNNKKKYSQFWVEPSQVIDADTLVKSMGIDVFHPLGVSISDCGVRMTIKREDQHYICTSIKPL